MKLRFNRLAATGLVATIALGAGIYSGCGDVKDLTGQSEDTNSSEGGASNIVLTGQLALTGEPTSLALVGSAPALADLDIYCVTFQLPPVAGTGDIGDDGSFELTIEASNTSVGCFILNGDDVLGTLVFEDPSKKDLAGGSKTADRYGFAGGKSNLGSIVLDLATGKATVDVSKIVNEKAKDSTAAAAAAVDLTGTYEITSAGLDLPKGYVGACKDQKGGERDCEGPPEGYKLWIKTVEGKDASTGKPAHALMFWQSEELFKTCGEKLGITYAQGKEHGVDFSASGVDEGEFDWDPNLVDGWKDQKATAKWSMMKMENVEEFKGYPGTKQYFKQYRTHVCKPEQPCQESDPIVADGFQFNANTPETGCKDEDGKPVQMSNWSNMQCEFEALTGDSEGLNKNTCSKKGDDGKTVTCTNIGGTFDANGKTIPNAMSRFPEDFHVYAEGAYCDYDKDGKRDADEWVQGGGEGMRCNNGIEPTPGGLCKDIPTKDDAGKLAQLRCYLDATHGGGKGDDEISVCAREIRANWSATSPDEFLGSGDGPVKAKGEHVFELFEYDSPTSGSLRGEDREFRGIQVGNNWTDCEVINVFTMALRKLDGSDDLLAEMSESQKNVSTKPACIAEFGEGKTQKMMFKLVKK